MPDITCPSCATVTHLVDLRRDASEFCPTCDYPLFWARSTTFGGTNGDSAGAGLRRLPGTAGRATELFLACPNCTEPNPVSGVNCIRCGADLHPVAAPPPKPLPPPPPVLAPPPPPPPKRKLWPIVLTIVLALIAVAVILYFVLR